MKRRFISFCIIASMLILKPCVTLSAGYIDIRDLHFVDSNDDYIFYNSEKTEGYARAMIKYSGTNENMALVSAFYKGDSLCNIDYTSCLVDENTGEIKSKKITIPTGCTAKIMLFSKPFTLVDKPYFYRSDVNIPEKKGEFLKASDYEKELSDALAYLNTQTGGKVFEYYKTLYDAETSFFYSSVSGKESYGYYPNMEATVQVLDKINEYGGTKKVKDYLTDEQKENMLTYLASMYHPETDMFYNPNAPYGVADEKRTGRDNPGWVGYILGFCGISRADFMKKYNLVPTAGATEEVSIVSAGVSLMAASEPTPKQRLEAASTVEEFREALEIIWQENLDKGNHPYSLGDSFSTYRKIAKEKGSEYTAATNQFLVDKQSAVTGLWGRNGKEDTEVSYQSTSAAMKFASCFKNLGLPYANYEKMVKNCIKVILSDEESKYIVYAWNPISAMQQAMDSFGDNVPDDFLKPIIAAGPEIIYKTVEKFEKFKMPDGGYSYNPGYAMDNAASMPVGLGLYESDIDGTGKINGVRRDMQKLLSINPYSKIYTDEELNGFFTALQNASKTVKNTNKTFTNTFEQYDITADKKPDEWTEVFLGSNSNGSVRAIEDPVNADNICVGITGGKYTRTSAKTGGFSLASENGQVQTVEFYLMVSSGSKPIYYITLGNDAVKLYVCGTATQSTQFTIAHVDGTYGWGKTFRTCNCDKWYRIKIEYLPTDTENTNVKIYVDGEEQSGVSRYYGYGTTPQKAPKKSIAGFSVTELNDSVGGILYIDNLKAYVK